MRLNIRFISRLGGVKPGMFSGAQVVVIDVLRATTSMLAALRFGCERIIPCATIAQAKHLARELRQQGEQVYLAGERGGLRIPGFDAGNSPLDFKKSRGKTVIMTTTNGTRALSLAASAREVVIAGLANVRAMSQHMARHSSRPWVILAAGENGGEALEDTYAAGRLLLELLGYLGRGSRNASCYLDASALQALGLALQHPDAGAYLLQTVHGKKLMQLGLESDIRYAAQTRQVPYLGKGTARGIVPILPA